MACYKSVSYVENTINKLHIQSDLHYGYIHKLYNDKSFLTGELFVSILNPY